MSADPDRHDRFFIAQRVRLMVNQYEVSTLADDGKSAGEPVCFVQQRRMKLKEDLTAWTDDTRDEVVFRIRAQQVWDPRATYDVTTASNALIGQLKKVFGKSLLRSTWEVLDGDGHVVARARERSAFVAVLRRVWSLVELIPLLGLVLALMPIPYHFTYALGEREVGELRRLVALRDRYILDLSGDSERVLDRRLALALAVGMDAMQAR